MELTIPVTDDELFLITSAEIFSEQGALVEQISDQHKQSNEITLTKDYWQCIAQKFDEENQILLEASNEEVARGKMRPSNGLIWRANRRKAIGEKIHDALRSASNDI